MELRDLFQLDAKDWARLGGTERLPDVLVGLRFPNYAREMMTPTFINATVYFILSYSVTGIGSPK
jgi:hypothetical protein